MSEVLRAILTKNCTWSKVAFYTGTITTVGTVTGVKSFARREVSIQVRPNVWFLCMGWAQFATYDGPSSGSAGKAEPTTFEVRHGTNREGFANMRTVKANQNFNLNNFVSLDEYPLFGPAELINIVMDVQVTDPAQVFTYVTYVTMQGVEFSMPTGMGAAYGNR